MTSRTSSAWTRTTPRSRTTGRARTADVRLLVTGGLGFIGSNFVRLVLKERAGWSVVNLDLVTYAGNPANLEGITEGPAYRFLKGDVAEAADIRRASEGCDAIVNFAAETHVD